MEVVLLIALFLICGLGWLILEGLKTPVSNSTDSKIFDEIKEKIEEGKWEDS